VNVLIVDDEPAIVEALQLVCEKQGWSATTTTEATTALELMNDDIDIVITDIIMPDMDGVQLISKIRKTWPEVKIIAISGGGDQGAGAYKPEAIATNSFLHAAQEAGAHAVLTKPFGIEDITRLIVSQTVS